MTGNTVLITGGGSGIGRGLAEALQRQGNTVIIAGRRQSALDEVTAANPGMVGMTLDIDDAAAIQDFAARVTAAHPALNVVINNAGIMRAEELTGPSPSADTAEATITTNLLGPIRLTTALLPHLQQQAQAPQGATVMMVTSGLAYVPLAVTPTYCATKAAIHSYALSLREQLRETGVEVIELVPPLVQTTLMGPEQASDATAMPLGDYIDEVMRLLPGCADTDYEVVVERAKKQRLAERSGVFNETFRWLQDVRRKAMEARKNAAA